jgi:hypothetical protein
MCAANAVLTTWHVAVNVGSFGFWPGFDKMPLRLWRAPDALALCLQTLCSAVHVHSNGFRKTVPSS